MGKRPRHIVQLGVINHKPKVALEAKAIFVETRAQLRTDRAQVYWIFDDLEITEIRIQHIAANGSQETLTLEHDRERDQPAARIASPACAFALSSRHCGRHPDRTQTSLQFAVWKQLSSSPVAVVVWEVE